MAAKTKKVPHTVKWHSASPQAMSSQLRATERMSREFIISASMLLFYLAFLVAKTLLWKFQTPSPGTWQCILLLNVLEAIAWGSLTYLRYGHRIGPVFLFLPITCALYTTVPLGLLTSDLNVFPFPYTVIWDGMLMQSLMLTHLWFFMGVAFSKKRADAYLEKVIMWCDNIRVTRLGVNLFLSIGVGIALLYLSNFYFSGAADIIDTASRIELINTARAGKSWLLPLFFACWLIVCAIVWSTRRLRSALSRLQVILAGSVMLVFPYISLRLGNRNELLFFTGFAATLLCLRGKGRLVALLAAVAIPFLLYLGLSRSSLLIETSDIGSVTFYLSLLGEFVFPHFPLLDHLNSHGNLWLGWSYLRLPEFFVPSLGLWDKPESLAIMFSRQYEGIGGID